MADERMRVGIVLPIEQPDDADAPPGYPEIRAIARAAEDVGHFGDDGQRGAFRIGADDPRGPLPLVRERPASTELDPPRRWEAAGRPSPR